MLDVVLGPNSTAKNTRRCDRGVAKELSKNHPAIEVPNLEALLRVGTLTS